MTPVQNAEEAGRAMEAEAGTETPTTGELEKHTQTSHSEANAEIAEPIGVT